MSKVTYLSGSVFLASGEKRKTKSAKSYDWASAILLKNSARQSGSGIICLTHRRIEVPR